MSGTITSGGAGSASGDSEEMFVPSYWDNPKLRGGLMSMVYVYKREVANGTSSEDADSIRKIWVSTDPTSSAAEQVKALLLANGGTVGDDYATHGGWVNAPVSLFESISRNSGVQWMEDEWFLDNAEAQIDPIFDDPTAWSDPSLMSYAALPKLNADNWHAADIKGQGVKIAILEENFRFFEVLPDVDHDNPVEAERNVFFRCYESSSDTDPEEAPSESKACWGSGNLHGSQVLESAIRVAPEATYYIASYKSEIQKHKLVKWLVDTVEVDIINHSVIESWSGPGNGETWLPKYEHMSQAQRENRTWYTDYNIAGYALSNDVYWVQALGNHQPDQNFVNAPVVDDDSDGWIRFNPTSETTEIEFNQITVNGRQSYEIMLRWTNPDSGDAEIDFYLCETSNCSQQLFVQPATEVTHLGEKPIRKLSGGELATNYGRPDTNNALQAYLKLCVRNEHKPTRLQFAPYNHATLVGGFVYRDAFGIPSAIGDLTHPYVVGVAAATASGSGDSLSVTRSGYVVGPNADGDVRPDLTGLHDEPSIYAYTETEDDEGNTTKTFGQPIRSTSFAAPHTAGLMALVIQNVRAQGNTATPARVVNFLKDNALVLDPDDDDPRFEVDDPPDNPPSNTGDSQNCRR